MLCQGDRRQNTKKKEKKYNRTTQPRKKKSTDTNAHKHPNHTQSCENTHRRTDSLPLSLSLLVVSTHNNTLDWTPATIRIVNTLKKASSDCALWTRSNLPAKIRKPYSAFSRSLTLSFLLFVFPCISLPGSLHFCSSTLSCLFFSSSCLLFICFSCLFQKAW